MTIVGFPQNRLVSIRGNPTIVDEQRRTPLSLLFGAPPLFTNAAEGGDVLPAHLLLPLPELILQALQGDLVLHLGRRERLRKRIAKSPASQVLVSGRDDAPRSMGGGRDRSTNTIS